MLMIRYGIILSVSAAALVHAQRNPPQIQGGSAARVMARIGPKGDVSSLGDLLRGAGSTPPELNLDELADSLTNRILSWSADRNANEADEVAAVKGVFTLAIAGSAKQTIGSPYGGAFDRLVRIHKQAVDIAVRENAVFAISIVSDRARMLSYLRSVAISRDPTARAAATALMRDADGGNLGGKPTSKQEREQSAAILRELARSHQITDLGVARDVSLWVSAHSKI